MFASSSPGGVSEKQSSKNPCNISLYWVVYRDPYIGIVESLYNPVVLSPIHSNEPRFV